MQILTKMLIALSVLFAFSSRADWAIAPDLESRVLWALVAGGNAEVVSTVGFGEPMSRHEKHTVFRLIKVDTSRGAIKWAVRPDGSYRPVMCREVWDDSYSYRGSSCFIPGCIPNSKKCLDEVTENF